MTSGDAIGKLELTVKAIEDSIVRLEATVEQQGAMIEQRDKDLDAQQEDLSVRCARDENQIADYQAKIEEAEERFTKAQDTASEQIRDLEERLLKS